MVPVCLETAQSDPARAEKLETIRAAPTYQRRDALMEAGWATVPEQMLRTAISRRPASQPLMLTHCRSARKARSMKDEPRHADSFTRDHRARTACAGS